MAADSKSPSPLASHPPRHCRWFGDVAQLAQALPLEVTLSSGSAEVPVSMAAARDGRFLCSYTGGYTVLWWVDIGGWWHNCVACIVACRHSTSSALHLLLLFLQFPPLASGACTSPAAASRCRALPFLSMRMSLRRLWTAVWPAPMTARRPAARWQATMPSPLRRPPQQALMQWQPTTPPSPSHRRSPRRHSCPYRPPWWIRHVCGRRLPPLRSLRPMAAWRGGTARGRRRSRRS